MRLSHLAVPLILVSTCSAGTLYTTEMTRGDRVATFKTWTNNKSVKSVVVSSTDPGMPEGMFMISRDGGESFIVGVPAKKEYLEITREQYLSLKGAQARQSGRVENPQIQPLAEQDGGKIAGQPTRLHKYRITVTLHMQRLFNETTNNIVVHQTFWMAEGIPNPYPNLNLLTRQNSGVAELDRVLEFKDLKGFPMKRVVEIQADGAPVGTSIVEVKELREEKFDDSVFAVPADYKKVEVPAKAE